MTDQSRLTINVNCSYVKDWGKTLDFLRKLNPVAVVAVIDNKANSGRIREIKNALPNAKVIARCVIVVKNADGSTKELDGSMHTKPQDIRYWLVSPGNFLDEWGELGKDGLTLSYMNEPMIAHADPADIARQVQHMIETIGLATTRGISLCVGNWGVGHELTAAFDDVIEIVGKQRELHCLGIHAYAPVDTFNCVDAILARVKARGFAMPRIVISEFGYDTSGPDDKLNGYKSRKYTGVEFAGWAVEKVRNQYRNYIQDGALEAVAVFGWGYAASFPAFDVETDTDWQTTILDAANKGLLSVPTKPLHPVYTIPAAIAGGRYVVSFLSDFINVRPAPIVTGTAPLTTLESSNIVTFLERMEQGGEYWDKVRTDNGIEGWISRQDGKVLYTALATSTPPPVIPLPAPETPPVVIPDDVPPLPLPTAETVFLMTGEQRAALLGHMLAITNLLIGLQETNVSKAA